MSVKYDAFISYKHGDLDRAIALKLQTLLEHLRVPASDKKKNTKKIERIFLDTGELSSSSDFLEHVESALRDADWLIVLCSPGSKNSPWCKLEIDTYLKYHDMSHILLLLTEGEPETAFPDRLLAEEQNTMHILAADARGKNKQESLRKLKKEAVYKLGATMLGLSYDDLKQRRKNYIMQRIAVASAAAFFVLACFTGYIIYQAGQITHNYNKARQNQARYMTTISNTLLANGDRALALLTANAIPPENADAGPLVPEQLYSLNRALGSFKQYNEYLPTSFLELGNISYSSVSADKKYAFALTRDKLTVLSNESEEITGTIYRETLSSQIRAYLNDHPEVLDADDVSTYSKDFVIDNLLSNFTLREMIPFKDHQLLMTASSLLLLLDPVSQELIYCRPVPNGELSISEHRILIYDTYPAEVLVISADDGRDIAAWSLADLKTSEEEDSPRLKSMTITPDGKQAALSFYMDDYSLSLGNQSFTGTILLNPETGQKELVSDASCCCMSFTGKGNLAMITESVSPEEGIYHDSLWSQSINRYTLELFDLNKKKTTFSSCWKDEAAVSNASIQELQMTFNGKSIPVTCFCLKGDLILVDSAENAVLFKTSFHSEIVNICLKNDSDLLVTLITGQVLLISLYGSDQYRTINRCNLNTEVFYACSLSEAKTHLFFTSRQAIYCHNEMDPYYKEVALPDYPNIQFHSITYVNGKEQNWRIAMLKYQDSFYSDSGFAVYPLGESDSVYSWLADAGCVISDCCFREVDGHLLAVILEENEETHESVLRKIDVTDDREILSGSMSEYISYSARVAFSEDLTTMYIGNYGDTFTNGISILDISGNEIKALQTNLLEDTRIEDLQMTGDGTAIILVGRDAYYKTVIQIYDVETKEVRDFSPDGFDIPNLDLFGLQITPGVSSSLVFVRLSDTAAFLLDTMMPDCPVRLEEDIDSNAGFFDQDQYLLYVKNDTIYLYDTEEHAIATSYQNTDILDTNSLNLCHLVSDGSGEYFALNAPESIMMDPRDDNGLVLNPMFIFYVSGNNEDRNRNIYLYATCTSTYMNPRGKEITFSSGQTYSYTQLYSYADLCAHAEELLGDRTLDESQLQALLSE